MQYRVDEKSGNKLSVLGYGCMRLPRNLAAVDMKKADQLIMKAIGAGVNYFDVAYLYPGSEAALGTVLANHHVREKVFVATKLPIGQCRKTEDFGRLFSKQLADLKTSYVDYYLMHNINTLAQWQALVALGIESWIAEQKASGAVRQVGFSFHGAVAEFMKLIDAYDWDFCQIQYNYSDENYQAGVAGLRRAAEKGMPVIIMEPLLGGKLATGLPEAAADVFKKQNPTLSPAAFALRWLWNQPEVTTVLSGMGSEAQLEDNLKTAETARPGMLSPQELAACGQVVGIFKESYKVPCTGCAYCMPCPQGVNIPGCFSAYNTSYGMGRITGFMQYTTSTAANRPGHGTAARCIGCGKCETHCPQHIAIREELKKVERRMEPFYFKAIMRLMRGKASGRP